MSGWWPSTVRRVHPGSLDLSDAERARVYPGQLCIRRQKPAEIAVSVRRNTIARFAGGGPEGRKALAGENGGASATVRRCGLAAGRSTG